MSTGTAILDRISPCYRFTIITLIASLVILGGCKSKKLPGQFVAQEMQVDGKLTEWAGLSLTHFEDDGFSVGVANDTNRLFLLFRTHDGNIVRTIRMTGMHVWFNVKGKRDTGFGVNFRGGPSFGMSILPRLREDMIPPGANQRDLEEMTRRKPLIDTSLVFTFIDEKKLIDLDIPPDGTLGPAIAIDTSEGFYTYEFSIPLQESEVRFFGLGASPNSDIAINVKWGEIDREEMRERMGDTRGGEVGGRTPIGGGRPDGGMRGGPPRGMDKRPQLKKVDIWFTTQLESL